MQAKIPEIINECGIHMFHKSLGNHYACSIFEEKQWLNTINKSLDLLRTVHCCMAKLNIGSLVHHIHSWLDSQFLLKCFSSSDAYTTPNHGIVVTVKAASITKRKVRLLYLIWCILAKYSYKVLLDPLFVERQTLYFYICQIKPISL